MTESDFKYIDPHMSDLEILPQVQRMNKVPEVTIYFWIIKVLCTTVGETASDFMNVHLGLGLTGTSIAMGVCLMAMGVLQFRAQRYIPSLYWLTVVLISVFGTLVTDILTDNLGVPLEVSTAFFSVALGLTFALWYITERTLSIHSIFTTRREIFYWLAILFTFALGTAVGDLMAESLGLGYLVTGIIVCGVIVTTTIAWRLKLDAVLAFWIVYILTRPLGASLGDYLSQSQANGGVGLGAMATTAGFLIAILAVVTFLTITRRDFFARPPIPVASTVRRPTVLGQVAVVLAALVLMAGAGYMWRRGELRREAMASTSSAAPLGDLSPYRTIAMDALALVRAGDVPGAKSRMGDLELAWDKAAARMQAMNIEQWSLVDDVIDDALKKVRSGKPDQAACTASLQALIARCSAPAEKTAAPITPVPKSQISLQASLGDLTAFRTIAEDTLRMVERNDLPAAKTQITDLESAWDKAEGMMRAKNTTDWEILDRAIDKALGQVRADQPDVDACTTALKTMIGLCSVLPDAK